MIRIPLPAAADPSGAISIGPVSLGAVFAVAIALFGQPFVGQALGAQAGGEPGATADPPEESKRPPLILVTNDEGVRAPGLRALALEMREVGDVIVAAPSGRRLGASQSLPIRRDLEIRRIDRGVFAIDSTPAGCVAIAVQLLAEDRRFALVVSGIASGPALGADTNISGTVGAARMAADLGIPAVAVSMSGPAPDVRAAARFTARLAREALSRALEPSVVLNVNFPSGPSARWRPPLLVPLGGRFIAYRFAGKLGRDDVMRVRTTIDPPAAPPPPGSDAWAHAKGHITLSVLPVLTAREPPKQDFEAWSIFDAQRKTPEKTPEQAPTKQ